ncbi:MAG: acyl-CoA mutase large subunit family protein [Ignavibacteria bacterium]|nr:acyl-CoA mutase large subunit family protein [Ignavibacteria bacterium]
MSKLSDSLNLKNDFPESGFDEWKKTAESDLKGVPFDKKLITKTYEGIEMQPIYTSDSIKNNPLAENLPGFENYVRGRKSSGYNSECWQVAREVPYPDPAEFNDAVKYDLERGQDTVVLIPDRASLFLHDADSANGTGIEGTSVSCTDDLDIALKDIDLTNHSIMIEAGFTSLPYLSMFAAFCMKNGFDMKKINASVTSSPVGSALTYGTTAGSFVKLFDDMAESVKWAVKNKYNIKTINVNGSIYVNAGASAVQELAFIIAEANEYISQMIDRGVKIDDIASAMQVTSGISTFYFMEIAKLRAIRILWANLIDAYGGNQKSKEVFVHAKTSRYYHTKNDIYVNILRTTTGVFSAILGGVDSLHSSSFDETAGVPDEFSRRLARNTQNILKEESHLSSLVDPAGGSYYVETLTSQIASGAWELFKHIEKEGGMLEAVKKGSVQESINKTSENRRKDYSKRKSVIVGNNMYANIKEDRVEDKEFDKDKFIKFRKEHLQAVKKKYERDYGKLSELLKKLSSEKSCNIDFAAQAFILGATLEDVSKACGYYDEKVLLKKLEFRRGSEIFEELRSKSFDYKEKSGKLPGIFLAAFGPLKQHKPRADFSRGFFEVGGFNVIYKKGFGSVEEAVDESLKSGVNIFAVCSTDETYPELVPDYVSMIKSSVKDAVVILAGYPKEQIEDHKKSGIDEFIYLGADVYEINMKLLNSVK